MTRAVARVLVLVVLAAALPKAQVQPADRWGARLAEAFSYLGTPRQHEAAAIFNEVVAAARRDGDIRALAEARRGQGRILFAQRDTAGTNAAYQESLQLFESVGDWRGVARAHSDLAFAAWQRSDWDQVRVEYGRAADAFARAGRPGDQAEALRNATFGRMSRSEAIATLENALPLARQSGDRIVEGLVLHALGDRLSGAGDQQGALERYDEALPLLERGADESLARLLTSIGRLHRIHGDPARALESYQRALTILETTKDRDAVRQAEDAVAIALSHLGRGREALVHAEQALAIAEASRPTLVPAQRVRVGQMALNVGDVDRALALFAPEPKAPGPAVGRFIGRAFAFLARHDVDSALTEADAAVAAAEAVGEWQLRITAFTTRSVVSERAGRLEEATTDAVAAVHVLEGVRSTLVVSDDFRVTFADGYRRIYDRAVDLLARGGRARDAFDTAEAGRARALLDLRRARTPDSPAGDGVAAARVPAPALATTLRPGDTLIAYWVMRESTQVWVLNAGGIVRAARIPLGRQALDGYVAQASGGRADPAPNARLTRRGEVEARFENDPRPALRLLHNRLIAPLRPVLPRQPGARLLVIPDGALLGLSFAELLSANGRYLVEDYTLQYAPSVALLGSPRPRGGIASAGSALLVSVSRGFPKLLGETLAPLPGARREVDALAGMFGAGLSTRMHDDEATEAAVRGRLAESSVVHLATHAIVSGRQPDQSFLALRAGAGHDGRLTAGEIVNLSLKADLVVLSACRGASGQVSGEGMLGLSRAILGAGAHALLASVRELPDAAAVQMVPRFYGAWRASGDAAAALRAAQLAQLRRLRAGRVRIATPFGPITVPEHPAMWGGLVLIGER